MSLSTLLTDHPFADTEALVHTTTSAYTKAEVMAEVEGLAAAIGGVVDPGQPVGAIAEGVDALIAMFACWQAEAVFVPINPRQPETAIEDTLARTRVGAVVAADRSVTERQPPEDGHDGPSPPGAVTTHPPGSAFVLWTSGTTGRPKAVLHTHEAYLEIIDRVLGPLRTKPRDPARPPSPNLIPVSMALNAGIYNALFGLRAGAPLVMMDGFTTEGFASLVSQHSIRSTVLPPAAMAMLSDDDAVESLAPLRYVRSITAPLSPFQARRFTERFGVTVLNGYGQAEIGEVIGWTAADAKAHPAKVGAIGKPHPGVEIRLGDLDELLVKPPNLAAGYADGGELEDRLTEDGFVRTGDVARIDADGFVWIEGRIGDLINRGGNKVFPEEVEEVIASVPGVGDVAVVGVADPRLGEVPVAVVVADPDLVAGPILEATCREHLVAYKVPVRFLAMEALPRNEIGKLLRTQLASELARQTEAVKP